MSFQCLMFLLMAGSGCPQLSDNNVTDGSTSLSSPDQSSPSSYLVRDTLAPWARWARWAPLVNDVWSREAGGFDNLIPYRT